MTVSPAITLLTDFGSDSHYVAQMKGAILSVAPGAVVIDLTHAIPPQDIRTGGWILDQSIDAFPANTIHLAVVDPGVGSERAILAAKTSAGYFVAPDNGVLSIVFDRYPPTELVQLTNRDFWRTAVSATFHGRDVMAPVAAHLSQGARLTELGSLRKDFCRQPTLAVQPTDLGLQGEVLYVDSFGNLITNIAKDDADKRATNLNAATKSTPWSVKLETPGGSVTASLANCYADIEAGGLMALFGSSDLLEIAVSGGSAASSCGAGTGGRVWLEAEAAHGSTEN